MGEVETAIQTIQAILAPAVMITGVALLLLTFNARHSSLVNRIRLLDDEKRELYRLTNAQREKPDGSLRLKSINDQLSLLLPRVTYLRNGMLCQMLAAMCFVLTSFAIGLGYFSLSSGVTQAAIPATFTLGMFLVLVGIAFQALEIFVSYRVILVEVKN